MSLSKSNAVKIGAAVLGSAFVGYSLYKLLGNKHKDFTDVHNDLLVEMKKTEALNRSSIVDDVRYKLALSFLPNSETYEGFV